MSCSSASRWSPLACLPPAALTPSGLVKHDTDDGEVELSFCRNVELRNGNSEPMKRIGDGAAAAAEAWSDRDTGLSMTLTTHRLILSDADSSVGPGRAGGLGPRFVHLSAVHVVNAEGGPSLFSPTASYKMALSTYTYGDLVLVFRGSKSAAQVHGRSDRDDALAGIRRALERRAWEEAARRERRKEESAAKQIVARKVGVDAVLTKNRLWHAEAKKLTDEAFADGGDVEALMREAGDLVAVIRRYAADLERSRSEQGAGGADADADADEADAKKLAGMLEDMGMTGALTKEQALKGGGEGAYYQRLARQLTDFLRRGDRLKAAGGMMTLTDVYCLFNRARGTNMISPEDLLKALHWTDDLNLGISRREFPSGVTVVQDDDFDDEAAAQKLLRLLDDLREKGGGSVNAGGITVLDASRSLKVSALLANEQLLSAERLGHLCRDSTLEGMRFFRNRFVAGDWEKW